MNRWTEQRTGRKTTYEFEAIDRVRHEAATIASLSDSTHPPVMSAAPLVVFVFSLFLAMIWRGDARIFFLFVGAVAAVLFAAQTWRAIFFRKEAAKRNVRARYTVAIDGAMFTVRWDDITITEELAVIDRFELANVGIDLVRRDGTHLGLPFTLGVDDPAFAAELGLAIERTRSAAGYRGMEPEEDETDERARRRS